LTLGWEACNGASGADVVALGVELPVDGVGTDGEVEPGDEPDCEVEGELEPEGAPLPGAGRSLPGWEPSPGCACAVDGVVSGAVAVAARPIRAWETIAPPASTSVRAIRARLLNS
jgi:hypothetical protein